MSQVCSCGFRFSGAGEFRNCEAFITQEGKGGVTCPDCGKHYVDGKEIKIESNPKKRTK